MLITAEHCLFFDGKFVPARMLVNGRSIFFDKSVTSYDYYHIETEAHSVVMADGMLTESYLDTGNRRAFSQKGNVVSIGGSRNLTWDDAAAPLGVSREFAEPLFRQAEARAIAAGITQKDAAPELTEEANLHLITDTGVSIRHAREHNGRIIFMIPTGVQSIRIASNASRPSDVVGPFVDDRRYFGVAVGDITLFEGNRSRTITSHLTDRELDGWNALEWEDCRWTSGNGLLPLGERHPNSVALIAIQIRKTGPYLATDTVQKKAALRA
uniref:Hint domain-containing protein n=1 Tax=Acetobacter pasteurianus TaxID=438 RepID=UPI00040AF2DC|nr:Hint domain-containing protein [Acetobacter pasteurianus]